MLKPPVKKNHFTMGIFIDLKKAFDTVDHGTLLKKLDLYDIRGISGDFLRSYLSYHSPFSFLWVERYLVWGNTCSTNSQCLYLRQKRVMRNVTHSEYLASTNELFVKLNILKVKGIVKYKYLFPFKTI